MPKKPAVSVQEAASSIRKILGARGLENIPKKSSPLWKQISQDLKGKWKASTIHAYVHTNYHQILTLARAALTPKKSKETLTVKKEPDHDEPLTDGKARDLTLHRRILTKEEKSILLEYEKLELKETEILSLFAVTFLRSIVVCPLRKEDQINESQCELSCSSSFFRLPITLDVERFRKFLQDGKNCPSSFCRGPRSSMVFPYKNEFRLHVWCRECDELYVYRLSQLFKEI